MKTYFAFIKITQIFFLRLSIALLMILPIIIVFLPDVIDNQVTLHLYTLSHIAVFFVMLVRPLADIITGSPYIRPLVILRKGVGVFSASIIISFLAAKFIMDPSGYIYAMGTAAYWSFNKLVIFAHLADISAILLIITSNNISKKILGKWWKRIQQLSYVYFYASSLYVIIIFQEYFMILSASIVTLMTLLAYIKKKRQQTLDTN